jgi:hypothetical protein
MTRKAPRPAGFERSEVAVHDRIRKALTPVVEVRSNSRYSEGGGRSADEKTVALELPDDRLLVGPAGIGVDEGDRRGFDAALLQPGRQGPDLGRRNGPDDLAAGVVLSAARSTLRE